MILIIGHVLKGEGVRVCFERFSNESIGFT